MTRGHITPTDTHNTNHGFSYPSLVKTTRGFTADTARRQFLIENFFLKCKEIVNKTDFLLMASCLNYTALNLTNFKALRA